MRFCYSIILICLIFSSYSFCQTQIEAISPAVAISPDSLRLIQPKYSPDGKWIAAAGDQYHGIALLDSLGHFVRWLTKLEGAGFRFHWSAAGKIVCRVFRTENKRRQSAIAVFNIQEDSVRFVTAWGRDFGLPDWCNQGHSIYFLQHNELVVENIERPVLSDEEEFVRYYFPGQFLAVDLLAYIAADRLIIEDLRDTFHSSFIYPDHNLLDPVLSPDKTWVAFEVLGLGLQLAQRSGKPIIQLGEFHYPAWSPNGNWLACYSARDDGLRIVSADLFAISADGKQTIQITKTDDIQEQFPDWSGNGKTIICSDNLSRRIFRIRLRR